MCLPVAQSIMLPPTAEQHLFIRLDRWKRGQHKGEEGEKSRGEDILPSPASYLFHVRGAQVVNQLCGTSSGVCVCAVMFPVSCTCVIWTAGWSGRYSEGRLGVVIEPFASSVTLPPTLLCCAEGLSVHYIVLLHFISTSEMSQGNGHTELTRLRHW